MSRWHVPSADLDRELDGFEFPPHFDFGVSTSGYQTEGGYNTPTGPKNNWYWLEARGKIETTGDSSRFLEMYEEDFTRAQWLGANAFRLGIEWARMQPGVDPALTAPPPFSPDAARMYARILAASFAHGMFPAVTLWHFTHPLWAGADFWLDWGRVEEWFGAYLEYSISEINRLLVEEHHQPPIPYYITMNEPINVPMAGYLLGVFPVGRKGRREAGLAYANILRAHILAYRMVNRIYRERNWPRPTVTINTWVAAPYSFDKIAQDLFLARAAGVSREGVPAMLSEQRERLRAHLADCPYLRGPQWFKRQLDRAADRTIWKALTPETIDPLLDMIYAGDEPRLTDVVGIDLYDPFIGNNFDFPVTVRSKPYQWNANPHVFHKFLEAYEWLAGETPIHLLEHGMCHRMVGNRVYPHVNGLSRDQELKEAMLEVVRSIRAGRRLQSFYYWSLVDNYEWGSYEPRFGLFGVDFANGARRLPVDVAGSNAAGAFRLFAEAFRARDKQALREVFQTAKYPEYSKP